MPRFPRRMHRSGGPPIADRVGGRLPGRSEGCGPPLVVAVLVSKAQSPAPPMQKSSGVPRALGLPNQFGYGPVLCGWYCACWHRISNHSSSEQLSAALILLTHCDV
jgi:hypothetical protein